MKHTTKRLLSGLLSLTMVCGVGVFGAKPAYSQEMGAGQVQAEEMVGDEGEVRTSDFKTSGVIWTAGDSISADHGYENEANYARFVHGWGEYIGDYLTNEAVVHNQSISGQSAMYFIETDNYKQIMDGIGEGDFLLIQFGHNDYKNGDYHAELPTDHEGSYKWYLKHYYIDPALKAGAMPVLCTSVVQCRVSSSGVISSDQAQKDFALAMKELYDEYCAQGIEIGYIDTYALTQMYLGSGAVDSKYYYALKWDKKYDSSGNRTTSLDHVHFSEAGARMTADMIAQNLMLLYGDFNRFNKKAVVDGGEGTQSDPYLISTWCQLYQILQDDSRNTKDTYYKLTNHLMPTVDSRQWTTRFYANLDGNGKTIYNGTGTHLSAIFDENYGTIKNVNLRYNILHVLYEEFSTLAADNYGVISNCTTNGKIDFTYYKGSGGKVWNCGAIVSVNHQGAVVENCENIMDYEVYGSIPNVFLGGIAGRNAGAIRDCTNKADLLIDTYEYDPKNESMVYNEVVGCAGGIAGVETATSVIENCSSEKTPGIRNSLKYLYYVKKTDAIAPLTEAELQQLLDAQKPEVTPQPSQNEKGDVNGDNKITLEDAQLTLKLALKIMDGDERQLKAADLNDDGMVTLDEAQTVLKKALNIL